MNDQNPYAGDPQDPRSDDTTPVPPYAGAQGSPQGQPSGTRPGHEDTSVLPGWYAGGQGTPPPAQQPAREKKRRGLGVGVLLGSLVLGAGAGFGGAAAYDYYDDDPEPGQDAGEVTNSTVSDRPDTPAVEGSPEAVAADVLPSVVKINVRGGQRSDTPFGGQGQIPGGSGSGVVLSSDGEILTNEHVVALAEDGGEVSVSFSDGTSAPATIIGTDPVTDLAVIKAQDVSGLQPATIGNSDDLGVGEVVVAIGSPYGLDATVTSGIVSALNRAVSVGNDGGPGSESTTYPAIQTDAAINPGNSGGPLVNLAGEVVGINSSIRTTGSTLGGEGGSIGLGFAIPISKVLPIVEQLRNGENPTHARLGVTVSDASSGGELVAGASVEEVNDGSAADEAGLEEGDIVVRVDDYPIPGVESLVATIRGYRPGDEVTLTIVRDGETQELTATLESDAD